MTERDRARGHLDVKIRKATIGDLDEFAKNMQSVAEEGKYLFIEEFTQGRRRWLEKLLKDDDCLVLVAEIGKGRRRRLVGSLVLERYGRVKKTSHVRTLGVLVVNGYRGVGIGNKLVARGIGWAKSQREIEKVALGVFSNNKTAIQLYEKFGFEVEGVKRAQYYIDGRHEDEIDMALFLR